MEHEGKRAELLTQILQMSTNIISSWPLLQQLPAAPYTSIARVQHPLWTVSALDHTAVVLF